MTVKSFTPGAEWGVDPKGAASILNLEVGTLAMWRSTGRYGLPYYKVGRNVRYDLADLQAWLEKNKRQNGTTV